MMRQAVFILLFIRILQSWLKWYSIGLENRHSARISGFESQALRFCSSGGTEDTPVLGTGAVRRESSNLSGSICPMYRKKVKMDSIEIKGKERCDETYL